VTLNLIIKYKEHVFGYADTGSRNPELAKLNEFPFKSGERKIFKYQGINPCIILLSGYLNYQNSSSSERISDDLDLLLKTLPNNLSESELASCIQNRFLTKTSVDLSGDFKTRFVIAQKSSENPNEVTVYSYRQEQGFIEDTIEKQKYLPLGQQVKIWYSMPDNAPAELAVLYGDSQKHPLPNYLSPKSLRLLNGLRNLRFTLTDENIFKSKNVRKFGEALAHFLLVVSEDHQKKSFEGISENAFGGIQSVII
jgi:hypothetical protein